MAQEQKMFFDETELANIIIDLSETIHDIQVSKPVMANWDDLRKKFEKYLKKLRDFASEYKADQFNIRASIGWPPKIDVGLTFSLSK